MTEQAEQTSLEAATEPAEATENKAEQSDFGFIDGTQVLYVGGPVHGKFAYLSDPIESVRMTVDGQTVTYERRQGGKRKSLMVLAEFDQPGGWDLNAALVEALLINFES